MMANRPLSGLKTFLLQLTSLQLLHSIFDVTISAMAKAPSSKDSIGSPPPPILESGNESGKDDDQHSSSTPSGYETGSHRGSHFDLHRTSDEEEKSSRTTTPERLHYASEKFHNNPIINEMRGEKVPFIPSPIS